VIQDDRPVIRVNSRFSTIRGADGSWNGTTTLEDVDDMSEAWALTQGLANKIGRRVELCSLNAEPERVIYGFREPNPEG
jgi:hypothetical protein